MAVLFVFIDGIGVGNNSSDNPLANDHLQSFSLFTGRNGLHNECKIRNKKNLLYKPIDANLGVEGLPQSGTGQVALFSGVNAAEMIGKHFGPYPYSTTKPILENNSLFHKTIEMGKSPHFLNAYPDIFFQKSKKRDRWTCTTLMTKSSGIRLNGLEEIKNGEALTAEIIQNAWREMLGIDVPEITIDEASQRVMNSLKKYDMVLYEYYLTDKAGHEMNREKADYVLKLIDDFLMEIIISLSEKDTLVITSDHGNIEDLKTKSHTRNPVPLFVKGNIEPFKRTESIMEITPAIMKILSDE